MEYYKLVAVTGLPGLYELISSKKDGAIVRSLQDKTTKFASSRIHQFSHLESIEIYTTEDNVNLVEVLHAIESSSEALPNAKDDKAVKAYFQKVYPQMDFNRVYNSDMKKIVKWYEILKENKVEIKLSEQEAEDENTEDTTEAAEVKEGESEKSPKKIIATKKAADKTEDDDSDKATPKKAPAKKKAAPKKKAE